MDLAVSGQIVAEVIGPAVGRAKHSFPALAQIILGLGHRQRQRLPRREWLNGN